MWATDIKRNVFLFREQENTTVNDGAAATKELKQKEMQIIV